MSHRIFLFLLFSFFIHKVQAYPDFIGYGYRSCLICHESGSGGGALTDYGRGVFASEIAANPIRKWLTDEEVAAVSNFLGPVELPFWLRLGFKYRALSVERSPGGSQNRKNHYNMQNDLNINLFLNPAHTLGLISTIGYVENPQSLYPNKLIKEDAYLFYREYFIKAKLAKEFWLYTGLMDKVFGIKTVNHTAVNRAAMNLGQNDQIHAGLLQWARKDEDIFFQYWLGNLHQSPELRQHGGSIMIDKKWGGQHAFGLSYLNESNDYAKQSVFALHNKMGFQDGNSLLMESGYRVKTMQQSGGAINSNSYYIFTQNSLNITRGIFLTSSLELSKNTTSSSNPENLRWDIGFLVFPIQKVEFRFSGMNQKTINAEEANADQWSLQSQIHLSL